ncbi:DUF1176 domain-containing protein [Oricola sp.]|uniref:DUF1176 domain-containing protein n=1 Tax=Oricola sp. TaxID=1979950 RepID=UPI0025DD4DB3|nr:DUF1176 domain-containing protein [Oricola sp.]MCI5074297.1 DUF1176 domain-containing protein [Oricola sp.]
MRQFLRGGRPSFHMAFVPVLALVLACVAPTGDALASQFKRIRDISVSCTDALTCDVFTYNAQSELYSVIFRRAARPDAPVRLVLGVRETLTAGSVVEFSIDGQVVSVIDVSDLSYRAAVYEYSFDGEAEIAALIAAARSGRQLRVSYRARGLDTVSRFSLSGFVAGLSFMDEVQGRVGREDALQAGGDADGSEGSMLRAIALIEDLPFQLRAEFSDRNDALCRGTEAGRFADLGGFEAGSGDDSWLIGLPCGTGGAYNQPFAFWERTGSRFRPAPLPVMTGEGPSTDSFAWNVSWDQERQQLTGFFKGRGLGDCGTFNRWIWKEGGSGHVFVLTEARAKETCDGDPAGGPENWPRLWPPQD